MACSECGCGGSMHLAWCTHANATKFKAEAYNLRQENEKLRRELREQGLAMTGRKIEEPKPAFQNIPLPKHTRAVFFVRRQGDASLVAQLLISNSRSFSLEPLPGDEWSFEVKNENMTVLMSQIRVMLAEDVQYRRV